MTNFDKIICVGKNYLDHARELGDAVPELPVLFLKPPSALRHASPRSSQPTSLTIPAGRGEIHHECEIVVRVGGFGGIGDRHFASATPSRRAGYKLTRQEAEAAITHVTLGLDMTLRDLQTKLKKAGHPWETSKAFLDSAVVGDWIERSAFNDYLETPFELRINGTVRQTGCGHDMRLSPTECVAYASEHFPLRDGDLIFTGTPAGVGPVRPGQTGELVWGGRLHAHVRWAGENG